MKSAGNAIALKTALARDWVTTRLNRKLGRPASQITGRNSTTPPPSWC